MAPGYLVYSLGIDLKPGDYLLVYIDVNWDVGISMDINAYLTANFNTQLIYDDDIDIIKDGEKVGPKVQFKETFGLSLTYNIQN